MNSIILENSIEVSFQKEKNKNRLEVEYSQKQYFSFDNTPRIKSRDATTRLFRDLIFRFILNSLPLVFLVVFNSL